MFVQYVDGVYSHMSVQYVNGKFFRAENGQLTKTLLCVMVKSIAGKYRDIVSMTPVVDINANLLYTVWRNVVIQLSNIGFDVAVNMTDGHSSNMTLFNSKILKNPSDLSIVNEMNPDNLIFPLFDQVYIFKNFYNNWNKKVKFECPNIDCDVHKKVLAPNFSNIQELYLIELGKPTNMAHKLTEKVLHSKVIEKSNVKLADSLFHESTMNALMYYADNGYPQFEDSAIFIKYIRDWFFCRFVNG